MAHKRGDVIRNKAGRVKWKVETVLSDGRLYVVRLKDRKGKIIKRPDSYLKCADFDS